MTMRSETIYLAGGCLWGVQEFVAEVLPLTNYVRSDEIHQDRLTKYPNERCHIPKRLLHKYKV